MARPRSNNKPQRKGTGSSFGKRSDAEKSYRKKDSSSSRSEGSDSKRSFSGKPSGFRKTSGGFSRSSDKPSFDKPSRPFSGSRPNRDEDKRERPRSGERSEGGEKKTYRRDDSSSARPYRAEAGKRPYKADAKGSDNSGFKKEFTKPDGFYKKDFRKTSGGKSDDRGFRKDFKKAEGFTRSDSRRSDSEQPERDGDAKRPSRKKDDFVKKPDGDFRSYQDKKSFGKEERKSFVQSRVTSVSDFTKPVRKVAKADTEEVSKNSDGLTRLNKYVANSGVGSRREADKLITMGLISVNGVAITELGTKVKQGDIVRYEDKILKAEKPVYILLNKPKGFITTTDDPQERNTVMALVAGACKERIYPVGRLDRNTTGLLLLTNDGDLADKLTHPSYKAKKVYKAELDKPITKNDLQRIIDGVHLEEGRAMVDDVAVISDDKKTVGLEIHIGWNRVVRRIFETLGYDVIKLDRSVYAGLDKKDTPRGNWRFLKPEEIVALKHFK